MAKQIFAKITAAQYTILTAFLRKVLDNRNPHKDRSSARTINTVTRKSFALKGIPNMLVCVEGTQPHPNTSTKNKLSNSLCIGR